MPKAEAMRVPVCGGLEFDDDGQLRRCLDAVHQPRSVSLVMHGGSRGADSLAGK
jgi:hypothetical protein